MNSCVRAPVITREWETAARLLIRTPQYCNGIRVTGGSGLTRGTILTIFFIRIKKNNFVWKITTSSNSKKKAPFWQICSNFATIEHTNQPYHLEGLPVYYLNLYFFSKLKFQSKKIVTNDQPKKFDQIQVRKLGHMDAFFTPIHFLFFWFHPFTKKCSIASNYEFHISSFCYLRHSHVNWTCCCYYTMSHLFQSISC